MILSTRFNDRQVKIQEFNPSIARTDASMLKNLNALTSSRSFDVEKRSNSRISLFCIYLKRVEVEIEERISVKEVRRCLPRNASFPSAEGEKFMWLSRFSPFGYVGFHSLLIVSPFCPRSGRPTYVRITEKRNK